ncbi:MAG TPA: NAD-dependent succinate-semialdehyde dehydrogenase [Candidatus Nanoarchaeia archaeon]|nr:NAD-dependent succinate-semialdehyde dehydrogenase [Candidatus Nanoarchaeia archaeon]
MRIQSINPYTEEVMKEFDYESEKQIHNKLKLLKDNKKWAELDIKEKSKAISNTAKELEKRKEECVEIISLEMGKPINQSIAEIEKCTLMCNHFSEISEKFLKEENIQTDFQKSYLRLDPLGVILGIMPWNFPFWQVFRFAVPALLIGNRIVVKHSSNVPQCALKIEEIFNNTLQENVYKNILTAGRNTSKLIESDYIQGASITGSTEAGSKVAEAAGRAIKKTVLELGGSDPFIILNDADLEKAASTASLARFINTGQSCIAAKRFIAENKIAKIFSEMFAEKINKLNIGDPLNKETDIGPLARKDLREELHDTVKRSTEQGAKILTGGKYREGKGYFYMPTLMCNVNKNMPIIREETFGPVAPVIIAEDEEDAVRIANDSEYGLGASIWTKDIEKAEKLARKIESGFIAINDMVKSDPRLPFGGIKKSGYGRELSHYAFYEFANLKTIVVK